MILVLLFIGEDNVGDIKLCKQVTELFSIFFLSLLLIREGYCLKNDNTNTNISTLKVQMK